MSERKSRESKESDLPLEDNAGADISPGGGSGSYSGAGGGGGGRWIGGIGGVFGFVVLMAVISMAARGVGHAFEALFGFAFMVAIGWIVFRVIKKVTSQ